MTEQGAAYYLSRRGEILAQFETHTLSWRQFLVARYGSPFADAMLHDTTEQYQDAIPRIPYIGGDENPMTRHLVRSTTSLTLYHVMISHGKTAEEAGWVIYRAVAEAVSHLPPEPDWELSPEFRAQQKGAARRSQERRYPDDWVWDFVEGDGVEFEYGLDFCECGTQKLYHAHGADEFLPYYCYLDFVTERTPGWSFHRTQTLAEGHSKCDFRWKRGGETRGGWPPYFVTRATDR